MNNELMCETQVNKQLGSVDSAINKLDSIAAELVARLGNLLRQELPIEKEAKTVDATELVLHAENLKSFSDRINGISSGLQNAMERLEI